MIGDRIKELRTESKMTQEELANKLNMSRQAISHWENGVNEPGIGDLVKLTTILNVSADYLLGITYIKENFKNDKELELYINDCMKVYRKHFRKTKV